MLVNTLNWLRKNIAGAPTIFDELSSIYEHIARWIAIYTDQFREGDTIDENLPEQLQISVTDIVAMGNFIPIDPPVAYFTNIEKTERFTLACATSTERGSDNLFTLGMIQNLLQFYVVRVIGRPESSDYFNYHGQGLATKEQLESAVKQLVTKVKVTIAKAPELRHTQQLQSTYNLASLKDYLLRRQLRQW